VDALPSNPDEPLAFESRPSSPSEESANGAPTTVLIVDDHPMMQVGATTYLNQAADCEVVGQADNADDAFTLALHVRPDVAIVDIRLKGDRTGIDLVRELRKEIPETKVIVLTNFPHEPYVRAMMELGVEGYLLKDTPPSDVLEAVRMVMRGRSVFSATVSARIVRGYLRTSNSRGKGEADALTDREADVLQLVADGRTNEEIAEILNLSVKAVQSHLTRLYSKLGARNRTEAVVHAARRGLVVLDHPWEADE
jgi:DNA-binding NarL/FixJ family response regulator